MSKKYWEDRWHNEDTPWDAGKSNPLIIDWFSKNIKKDAFILIPGAGSGHEFESLYRLGFENLYAIDIASKSVNLLREKCPNVSPDRFICADFFDWKCTLRFDCVLEQTFFCAIQPTRRKEYVKKMKEVIKPGGRLVGVLFNKCFPQGPPFGGTKSEYISLFSNDLKIKEMKKANDGFSGRFENELFVEMVVPLGGGS